MSAEDSKPFMLVAGDFVPNGGMDRANLALAEYLADSNKPVHLVTHRAESSIGQRPNVTTHLVPRPFRSHFLGGPLLDRAGRKLSREANLPARKCVVNGGNCKLAAINWIHYVHHAYDSISIGNGFRRIKTAAYHQQALKDEMAALKLAETVIANSERTKRDICELIGLPAKRVQTVYLGIDPDEFRPIPLEVKDQLRVELGFDPAKPLVAFVGALGDRRKGFDTLLAAWAKLCGSKQWEADLAVIGSGSELNAWKAMAADSGLGCRIHFLGFRKDISRVLSACDALVAPTRYEAFGVSVLEALCLGIPALTSTSAGVAERYPHSAKFMLLRDPESVDELFQLLRDWSANSATYKSQALSISESLRKHTWTEMSCQIAEVMQQVQ